MPTKKLDKFFAKKDQKKQEAKKEEKKEEIDHEEKLLTGAEFGVISEFTGKTVILSKEGAIEDVDRDLNPEVVEKEIKTWSSHEEVEEEAKRKRAEAEAERAEKEAAAAAAAKSAASGAYRPGQGLASRPSRQPEVSLEAEAFPTLGEATKYKKAEDFQKAKDDEKKKSNTAFKPRTSPANAWSSQSAPMASQMGCSAPFRPASGGGAWR